MLRSSPFEDLELFSFKLFTGSRQNDKISTSLTGETVLRTTLIIPKALENKRSEGAKRFRSCPSLSPCSLCPTVPVLFAALSRRPLPGSACIDGTRKGRQAMVIPRFRCVAGTGGVMKGDHFVSLRITNSGAAIRTTHHHSPPHHHSLTHSLRRDPFKYQTGVGVSRKCLELH
ncbi:hypothetical protein E2C01_035419 [Portunus trituberculatus]|uniref:Uncharacterized protein n=1 Tax=Portunus trituberculatus TaxID=210409 RepID=A0A5B7F9Q1_PORTR|nr:hypothetical protein [Portunus trituberculatus]